MPLRFTSAMQTRTQDAAPEPAKQTGCQRAPGKVQLRLDLIQRAPCFTIQPTRISRQNQTGPRGQSPYRARRQHCGCNFDSATIAWPKICSHSATAMQASATAVRSKQRNSWRCSSKRCKRKQNRRQPATSAHAHHSKQVPKRMQILQRLLPKIGGDKAYRHRCNPSAISLQSEQHGNASASIGQTCRSFFPLQWAWVGIQHHVHT